MITKGISAVQKVNSNSTEAILDKGHKKGAARVPIPPEDGVEAAKDWVDNGSKL